LAGHGIRRSTCWCLVYTWNKVLPVVVIQSCVGIGWEVRLGWLGRCVGVRDFSWGER
jgi:hypothetical protein